MVVLRGTESNQAAGADVATTMAAPAGFGDCLLLRIGARHIAVTTPNANAEQMGPEFSVFDAGGARSELLGSLRWVRVQSGAGALTYVAYLELARPVLVRQAESFGMVWTNLETVAATADSELWVEVGRLRNLGG